MKSSPGRENLFNYNHLLCLREIGAKHLNKIGAGSPLLEIHPFSMRAGFIPFINHEVRNHIALHIHDANRNMVRLLKDKIHKSLVRRRIWGDRSEVMIDKTQTRIIDSSSLLFENNILITKGKPTDLMATIPIEAEEIEELMNSRK